MPVTIGSLQAPFFISLHGLIFLLSVRPSRGVPLTVILSSQKFFVSSVHISKVTVKLFTYSQLQTKANFTSFQLFHCHKFKHSCFCSSTSIVARRFFVFFFVNKEILRKKLEYYKITITILF